MPERNVTALKARAEQARQTPVNVGLIGLGTVGGGVVELFQAGKLPEENIHLKSVAVRKLTPERQMQVGVEVKLTNDPLEIVNDPNIDVVVEVMGGVSDAPEYMLTAMRNGKSVVTANKAAVAKHGSELFRTAGDESVDFAFDASVAGGIPILYILDRYRAEDVETVRGIINGTTNFILTKMEKGESFDEAVTEAQDKGYAEKPDHSLDTDGYDARDKLAIVSSLIYNAQIDPEKIRVHGIKKITTIDIEFAEEYGYAIKHLATAERKNGFVDLRVNPVLLPKTHPLASVRGVKNAVYLEGSFAGEQMITGDGAGSRPTASSVFGDIRRVARNKQREVIDDLPRLDSEVDYLPAEQVKSKGYIRVNLVDHPGSVHEVTGHIAEHGLNIKNSIQREKHKYSLEDKTRVIPYIITLESASQSEIDAALADLANSERVDGEPFFMSIEE